VNENSFIISGFGGQGTLFAGQVMAYSALDNDLNVTWIPSYGPEMRGGTASCTVVISNEPIGSPIVSNPDVAIVMNLPSLQKFETLIKPGGVIIVNSSLINLEVERKDIQKLYIPANQIAEEAGMARLANMVMIGSLTFVKPVLSLEMIKTALAEHIPDRHRKTIPKNFDALEKGFAFAENTLAAVGV
jgi:2-oxoglutarate ferredoxin oxidoreductase subunit gamma